MNPGDPHLTLALSPPIRWERRGKSRRMAAVARKSGRMRQVQGFKARIIRGILSPLRGEGRCYRTRPEILEVPGFKAGIFRGNLFTLRGAFHKINFVCRRQFHGVSFVLNRPRAVPLDRLTFPGRRIIQP